MINGLAKAIEFSAYGAVGFVVIGLSTVAFVIGASVVLSGLSFIGVM